MAGRVVAVERGLRVLELLAEEREPLTLRDVATRTRIPIASCHAILHTLEAQGYASRRIVGRSQFWEATLAVYHLGALLVARLGLRDVALPQLRLLAERTGFPAHLGVLVGTDVMYLEKAVAPGFIQFDTYPGKRSPFHLTALGRAIAGQLPPDQRERLVAELPPRFSQLVEQARRRGVAVEDGDEVAGVGCVAAPVYGAGGHVRASIGITGFSAELFDAEGADAVVDVVVGVARDVSAALGHGPAVAAPPSPP